MNRRTLAALAVASGLVLASALIAPGSRRALVTSTPSVAQARLPARLADSAFARVIRRISEPGGYFDTDNLISNESSYQHVLGKMGELRIQGGAYIGVGPDQNFSYIAQVQPRVAFILDIRRDNLLQHLWFKALFRQAPTRIEYLSLMFGRPAPRDPAVWATRSIGELIEYIDETPADRSRFGAQWRALRTTIAGFGVPLSSEDLAKLEEIHTVFRDAGLDLRFSSHGLAPRESYPTYRRLLLESDRSGRQANYLVSEELFRRVRDLQERNLILPVTGDFAGNHALREIGAWLRETGERITTFYASNVEFYLMQDRTFNRFAASLTALPLDPDGVIIRSLFGRIYGHPQSVAGYNSTQLLQKLSSFASDFKAGAYGSYGDLVYRTYIDLR